MKTSRYLFLQGQISHFFSELGSALQNCGSSVYRINFNGGDRRFWRLPGAVDFTGGPNDWADFFRDRLTAWGISDLVLFGDCRPLHREAISIANAQDVRTHVFEEGYLRPDYITMEVGGVNGNSSLPKDPDFFLREAASLRSKPAPVSITSRFSRRATDDIIYQCHTLLFALNFPFHRGHRPWHPFREYAVGLHRFPLKVLTRKKTQRAIEAIVHSGRPYFLFPLQLDADSQIRFHAPPGGIHSAIESVIDSFSKHAKSDTQLVITEHPLDYSPIDFERVVRECSKDRNVSDRVLFLRGGSPPLLIGSAAGLVTVNSTIGITALATRIPVIALGNAIYNMAGLTDQRGIDEFWKNPQPAEETLFNAFRNVVADRTQINGGYFSRAAIAMAVAGAVNRLASTAGEAFSESLPATHFFPLAPAINEPQTEFHLANAK